MATIKVPVDRTLKARLLSTLHAPTGGASYRLTDEVLHSSARGASSLTIISAFYDLKWCKDLIVGAKVKHVRLIVNGLGGRRLTQQKKELCDLKRDLCKVGIKVEVGLAFAPGIFHSKLILMDHDRCPVAFIGSANATTAAMERNEEIMLRVSGDVSDLISYADRICDEHSIDADDGDEEVPPRTLTAFFRTGSLYYKSVSSLQLTLNPFREIERHLSSKMKAQLGSVKLPHTDGKTGVGAFSLARALDLQVDQRSVAAKIKPFVVETSLGYWVPDALTDELRLVLKPATRTKRQVWSSRRDTIHSTSLAAAKALYAEYLAAVRGVLGSKGISLRGLIDPSAPDPLSVDRFDGFYKSVDRRLQNESFFDRLIDPFHAAALPELWDDPVARAEFEESFFSYVEFATTLPRCPRVPRTILNNIGSDSTDLRKALIKRLLKGWDRELWMK